MNGDEGIKSVGWVIPVSDEMLSLIPVVNLLGYALRKPPIDRETPVSEERHQPIPSGSPGFDRAVRAMARRRGRQVADDAKVTVEMTGEWSGYSEYTITNQWDEFTIRVEGVPEPFVYDTEEENRAWPPDGIDQTPRAALAKLWDDLIPDGA